MTPRRRPSSAESQDWAAFPITFSAPPILVYTPASLVITSIVVVVANINLDERPFILEH